MSHTLFKSELPPDYEKFIEACRTIATVIGDRCWQHLLPRTEAPDESAVLDTRQAAEFFSMGRSTFLKMVKDGKLPQPVRIGGRPKWTRSSLENNLNQLARKGTK